MKLLGWMHRKLRQSSNDVFKEFGGGGGSSSCLAGRPTPDHDTIHASVGDYFSGDLPDAGHPPPAITTADLFSFGGGHLLAIGTFGIAAVAIAEDGPDDGADDTPDEAGGALTPSFGVLSPLPEAAEKAMAVVEAIAEKDDDTTTEGDLMVVSAELEKVLGGGGGDVVASARASFAVGDCPLQGFLFGSPMAEAETETEQKEGRRASLGELFMRTRFAEEGAAGDGGGGDAGGGGGGGGEAGEGRGKGGSKLMKRRELRDEKGGGDGSGGGAPASSGLVAKSKFQKILQIFHRKVYPESSILTGRIPAKTRKRGAAAAAGGVGSGDVCAAAPKLRCRKERMPGFSCCSGRALLGPDDENGDQNGNKSGHWIKTDADYLVLEL